MQVKYYPKVDNTNGKWQEYPEQVVGMAVVYPDNYDSTKKYPFLMSVHGISERTDGMFTMIQNLVLGFDYDGNGTREGAPFLTTEMQKAVDQYGIIIAIPNYSNFFSPDKVNWVYDFVKSKYSIYDKFMYQGFSYGGGAGLVYACSNAANASKMAYCVLAAPTREGSILTSQFSTPGSVNLPVHIFVNNNDPNGPTNLSVTKDIITRLNANNPTIRAVYTAFNKSGHGGHSEAMTTYPPKAPGGSGLIDAGETVYQVFIDILKNGPRQMKEGVVVNPNPDPDPDPVPAITANAGPDQTVFEPIAFLDGTKSTGYGSAKWFMVQRPEGVSQWHPVVESGGWITTRLLFPKEGVYAFKLVTYSNKDYTGTTAEDTVIVTYNNSSFPPPKTVLQKVYIPKNDNFVYVYDDGSVETKPK